MSLKKLLNVFLEYGVLGTKILIAFATVLFKSIYLSYLYFVFDIISSFYQNFQEGRHRDLSEENFSLLNKASKKTKQDLDRIAKEQKVFYSDLKPKQTSLNLLNKLLNESIIRERDLLALTSKSEFYQLFIYSASFSRIAKTLKITPPKRKYPIFLQELGFARLGKNSPSFLINKNNLKEENLKEIKEFKKFLDYHLSRIKKEEWKDFLKKVKAKDRGKYERLNNRGLKTSGFLKTNFLLTQTNMNVTNIGLVDAERIGLGDVYNNDNIIQQIIQGSKIGKITPNNELKVKIKKAFKKLRGQKNNKKIKK